MVLKEDIKQPTGENCGTCKFCIGPVDMLECHFDPPVFVGQPAEAKWARVLEEDWCGKWVVR